LQSVAIGDASLLGQLQCLQKLQRPSQDLRIFGAAPAFDSSYDFTLLGNVTLTFGDEQFRLLNASGRHLRFPFVIIPWQRRNPKRGIDLARLGPKAGVLIRNTDALPRDVESMRP
jgi:hypothetical protein